MNLIEVAEGDELAYIEALAFVMKVAGDELDSVIGLSRTWSMSP